MVPIHPIHYACLLCIIQQKNENLYIKKQKGHCISMYTTEHQKKKFYLKKTDFVAKIKALEEYASLIGAVQLVK